MIIRYIESFAVALLVTFGVFFLMQSLVMNSRSQGRRDASAVVVDFARSVNESETQTKSRVLPEKAPPAAPPSPPALAVASLPNSPEVRLPKLVPRVAGGIRLAGGFEFDAPASDTDALPLVRIEPRYPSVARARGIEGWVRLRFTIGPTGAVERPLVESAPPKGVFDTAALRAVENWKYRPKVVDGKPVPRPDVEVTLEFKMED